MTHDLHKSTQDLISTIERKDKRFRLAQAIFMVATFIALIVIIGAQQRTLDRLQDQVEQGKAVAAAADKRDEEQTQKILRRLDCMTVFFSQTDRQNLSIKDIDRCTLEREGDPQLFFRQGSDGNTEVTEEPQSEGTSSQGTGSGTQAPVPSSPNTDKPDDGQNQVEPRPPVTVPLPLLPDLPLCIPFTNACIR